MEPSELNLEYALILLKEDARALNKGRVIPAAPPLV